VDEYIAEHADHRDDAGHALVVRNAIAEPRTVTTAAGALEIQAPRVHDRREGRRFTGIDKLISAREWSSRQESAVADLAV
jgi:hypothetical protein